MLFNFEWKNNRVTLKVNEEKYTVITYSPQLQFNCDITKFEFQDEMYGCFSTKYLPTVTEAYPLDIFGLGRYHTYYFSCLDYDGNPYAQVLFVLIDTEKKRLYESWMIGRAVEDLKFVLLPETKGFSIQFRGETIEKNEYEKKLGAAMICGDLMDAQLQ